MTFAGVGDDNVQIWILVQNLFDAAIITALFPRHLSAPLLGVVILIIIAQIAGS